MFEKSEGVTETEKTLVRLCNSTFMQLYAYPNLYTSQGYSKTNPQGRELCDVLVVHDNHIILFSDKSCKCNFQGDWIVSWKRWYRTAIERSCKQLLGARSWVQRNRTKVFYDRACKDQFQLIEPNIEYKIHLVAIANGAGQALHEYWGTTEPSPGLMVNTTLKAGEHLDAWLPGEPDTIPSDPNRWHNKPIFPFMIGNPHPGNGVIHVFDDVSISRLLTEFTTSTDFIDYLIKRECLILSGKPMIIASSEGDLISMYYSHCDSMMGYYYTDKPIDGIASLGVDRYAEYLSSGKRKQRQKANRISALWDSIIEQHTKCLNEGTLFGSDATFINVEKSLRILAREPRISRRMLSEKMYEASLEEPADGMHLFRYVTSPAFPNTGYLLCFHPAGGTDNIAVRTRLLSDICYLFANENRHLVHIIGIGTCQGKGHAGKYVDLCYMDTMSWSKEDEAYAVEVKKLTGLTASLLRGTHYSGFDFPVEDSE